MDIYESMLTLKGRDKEISDTWLMYGAWAEMSGLSFKDLPKKKEEFFKSMLPEGTDILDWILSDENTGDKKEQIKFLYDKVDSSKELEVVSKSIMRDDKKEKEFLDKVTPEKIFKILKLRLEDFEDTYLHISYVKAKGIQMYYFMNTGAFISIGVDVNLDDEKIDDEDMLTIFKALAEESRWKIVKALSIKDMTTSDLAGELGVTLSTVNHHLKQLISAGIVELLVESKTGKGAYYMLNRDFLDVIVDELSRRQ